MYFEYFPYIYYDAQGNNSFVVIKDILRRIAIRNKLKSEASFFFEYDVKDSDTPEIIATKIYGSPSYHWVILLMNDMVDPYRDWPLSQRKLNSFVTSKYGEGHENDIHHYEFSDGTWSADPSYAAVAEVSSTPIPITNQEYEDAENERKRRIKLLLPEYLSQVTREFVAKIKA